MHDLWPVLFEIKRKEEEEEERERAGGGGGGRRKIEDTYTYFQSKCVSIAETNR